MKKFFVFCFFISSWCAAQDLIITNVKVTTPIGSKDIFIGYASVKNVGIVDTNYSTYVKFYISPDNVYDPSDLYVGYAFANALKSGETQGLTTFDCRQVMLPAGTYYVIAIADPDNLVQETSKTNNTLVVSNYVINQPVFDFKFSSFDVAGPLFVKDTFYPSFLISNPSINIPNTPPNAFLMTEFFISNDIILDNNDLSCGVWRNSLGIFPINEIGGDQYSYSNILQIPNVNPGMYYIIAKVDSGGGLNDQSYNETDETNNTAVSHLIEVKPSAFVLQPVSIEGNAFGANLYGSLNIANNGTSGIANFINNPNEMPNFSIYLSSDRSYPNFPLTNLNFASPPNIPNYIGAEKQVSFPFNADVSQISAGVYYLMAIYLVPNDPNPVHWVASDNSITIGSSDPLSVSLAGASFTGQYDDFDKSFSGTAQLKNNGPGLFSTVVYYDVVIKDASSNIVLSSSINPYAYLSSGQTGSTNWSFSLSNPLSVGIYTVDLNCSDHNKCGSDHLTIPLEIKQLNHTLTGTIKGEDGATITNGKLFLYKKDNSGKVAFTQKIDPTASSDFSFTLDDHYFTLYFIPDFNSFPDYVPTIFGKSVTLSANNFFKISNDSTVVFEILKVQPLPSGTQTISGNVITGGGSSSGRTSGPTSFPGKENGTTTPVTVLLLDGSGNVVGITQTDGNGGYSFNNLPASNYQVVVMFELDQPALMSNPFDVDVTNNSKQVNFDFSSGSLSTTVMLLQSISFNSLVTVSYGADPISLTATSSSGLPIEYASSNTDVVTVSNNQLIIVGAGDADITASQSGNETYIAARDVVQSLHVSKADQSITFASVLPDVTADASPISLEAQSSSGLPVVFNITQGTNVVVLNENVLTLTGVAGNVTVVASQSGDKNHNEAQNVSKSFKVNLVLAVEPNSIAVSTFPNPTNGFVTIRSESLIKGLTLWNLLGEISIVEDKLSTKEHRLDLSPLAEGVYLVNIRTESGAVNTLKIIKVK